VKFLRKVTRALSLLQSPQAITLLSVTDDVNWRNDVSDFMKRFALAILALVSAVVAPAAAGQTYPDHFIKLIVPFPPGGATDVLGRILGKKMAELLDQPVVVENHAGAGGTIGTDFTSRQAADGYTVMLVSALAHTASKKLYANLKYEPTFAEAGMPQFDVTAVWGLIAPAGVPERAVAVLSDALKRAVEDSSVRETLLAQTITPGYGPAAQFGQVLQSEADKWSRVIDEANIKPQ
jgi:tripartite-type tricarboxylate transporter receptor subunit TctC